MSDERLKCIAAEWMAASPQDAIAALAARPQILAEYVASLTERGLYSVLWWYGFDAMPLQGDTSER